MKKRTPRCDENTSTPEPKKKKAPGWSNARIQWWNMLQDVNASDGYFGTIHEIVGTYVNNVNK